MARSTTAAARPLRSAAAWDLSALFSFSSAAALDCRLETRSFKSAFSPVRVEFSLPSAEASPAAEAWSFCRAARTSDSAGLSALARVAPLASNQPAINFMSGSLVGMRSWVGPAGLALASDSTPEMFGWAVRPADKSLKGRASTAPPHRLDVPKRARILAALALDGVRPRWRQDEMRFQPALRFADFVDGADDFLPRAAAGGFGREIAQVRVALVNGDADHGAADAAEKGILAGQKLVGRLMVQDLDELLALR